MSLPKAGKRIAYAVYYPNSRVWSAIFHNKWNAKDWVDAMNNTTWRTRDKRFTYRRVMVEEIEDNAYFKMYGMQYMKLPLANPLANKEEVTQTP